MRVKESTKKNLKCMCNMPWAWAVKDRDPRNGGNIGTPSEVASKNTWPSYEAAYLWDKVREGKGVYNLQRKMDDGSLEQIPEEMRTYAGMTAYMNKVSDNYKDEAEANLRAEFVEWLNGQHADNRNPQVRSSTDSGPVRKRVYYDGAERVPGGVIKDWKPTYWGARPLHHLPGVREFLQHDHRKGMETELQMNLLAEHGPQDIDQAWAYFKHWVKGRKVGPGDVTYIQNDGQHQKKIDIDYVNAEHPVPGNAYRRSRFGPDAPWEGEDDHDYDAARPLIPDGQPPPSGGDSDGGGDIPTQLGASGPPSESTTADTMAAADLLAGFRPVVSGAKAVGNAVAGAAGVAVPAVAGAAGSAARAAGVAAPVVAGAAGSAALSAARGGAALAGGVFDDALFAGRRLLGLSGSPAEEGETMYLSREEENSKYNEEQSAYDPGSSTTLATFLGELPVPDNAIIPWLPVDEAAHARVMPLRTIASLADEIHDRQMTNSVIDTIGMGKPDGRTFKIAYGNAFGNAKESDPFVRDYLINQHLMRLTPMNYQAQQGALVQNVGQTYKTDLIATNADMAPNFAKSTRATNLSSEKDLSDMIQGTMQPGEIFYMSSPGMTPGAYKVQHLGGPSDRGDRLAAYTRAEEQDVANALLALNNERMPRLAKTGSDLVERLGGRKGLKSQVDDVSRDQKLVPYRSTG